MIGRVQALLAVADRQRHVDAGKAQGLHLRDRARARPAHDQVRDGQRVLHRRQVVDDVPAIRQASGLNRLAHRLVLTTTGQVNDLRALGQRIRAARHRLVDMERAQRPAGDQQGRSVGVHAQALGSLAPGSTRSPGTRAALRQIGNRRPQRQPGHDRLTRTRRQRRGRERQGNHRGVACAHLIGQARARVLLVNNDRHARALGRNVGRGRHVAAKTHQHVRTLERLRAPLDRVRKTRGQREEGQRGAPGQRDPGNLHQRETRGGNQIRLQPRLRAQHDDLGAALAQLRGRRQKRIHVAGGPAASHHNLDHKRLLNASVTYQFIVRRAYAGPPAGRDQPRPRPASQSSASPRAHAQRTPRPPPR